MPEKIEAVVTAIATVWPALLAAFLSALIIGHQSVREFLIRIGSALLLGIYATDPIIAFTGGSRDIVLVLLGLTGSQITKNISRMTVAAMMALWRGKKP